MGVVGVSTGGNSLVWMRGADIVVLPFYGRFVH